jgi:hypothetical protein
MLTSPAGFVAALSSGVTCEKNRRPLEKAVLEWPVWSRVVKLSLSDPLPRNPGLYAVTGAVIYVKICKIG